MRRDLADQRDVSFFYLAVISYAISYGETGEDVDNSYPKNFFQRVSYVRICHQDLRR